MKNSREVIRKLKDYSEYTARVRHYAEGMKLEDAVERAITECIREGILSEFLSEYRAEARSVSIYKYGAEAHIHMNYQKLRQKNIWKNIGMQKSR